MRFYTIFPAIVWLIPAVTCGLGGMAQNVLQGLNLIPGTNGDCKQPFGNDAGNPIQTISDIVTGLLTTCPYSRTSNESTIAQMHRFITFSVLSK